MKYFQKDGKEFLENGRSKLRVKEMHKTDSPSAKGRVVRIFIVQEVVKQSPTNLMVPGTLLNLSFPGDKANAKEYKWHPGEESQLKFNIDLNGPTHTDGDPEPAKEEL